MQVAFWSTVHGQSGTTTNIVAIALLLAFKYRLKLLTTQNHFEKSTLERTLLDLEFVNFGQEDLSNINIDALGKLLKYGLIEEEEFINYTITLINNRLDLLPGTKNINKKLFVQDFNQELAMVYDAAKKIYDLVLIDTVSGVNELSKIILEQADAVVVCLNQNISVLDEYFLQVDEGIKEKSFYLIGRYDQASRLNIQTIKRKYKIKGNNIAGIPYSTEFLDACNERRAMDFFFMNHLAEKDDLNYKFMEGVKQSARLFLDFIGYDVAARSFEEQ